MAFDAGADQRGAAAVAPAQTGRCDGSRQVPLIFVCITTLIIGGE